MSEVDTAAPATPPPKRKRRWWLYVLLGGLITAIAALVIVTPGEDWIRAKLTERFAAQGIELQIEELDFSLLRKELELRGVHLSKSSSELVLDAEVATVRAEVSLPSLWSDELELVSVALVRPSIAVRFLRETESDAIDLTVRELVIEEGTLRLERPSGFAAVLEDVHYRGQEVALSSLPAFLSGADCQASLVVNERSATFELRASQEPQTMTLRGLDIGALDRLREDRDGIQLTSGTIDLTVRREARNAAHYAVHAVLRGLRAEADPNSATGLQRLIIAGVLALIGDGDFDFQFDIPSESIDQADSLGELSAALLNHLVRRLLSQLS